ncbi:Csu type fimbrial protein [Neisseria canis]|uniref:Uncharacterized secreted protein n=1 Tax=Neisseria canis TaxID=493 RepID=A0A1X3CU23_9NEIS|nr:spore coat U domain-containing protein [Neisseria canis]OSI11056.1 hypothetical protein BWD07_09795 [Neisseria canis]VEF00547.1 Uncharacterized secreted protein [Neisseria canis]
MFTINKIEKKPRQTGNPARLTAALSAILLSLLPVQEAWAKCRADMQNVDFGNVDILSPQPAATQAQVSVTCQKGDTTPESIEQLFNICLAVDGGRHNTRQINPRNMCSNGICDLSYNFYTDPGHTIVWSTPRQGGDTINATVIIPPGRNSVTVNLPVYAKLAPPFTNTVPGLYTADFSKGSTSLAFSPKSSCGLASDRFEFTASATVIPSCIISEARDINFGTVQTNATNLQGQSSFKVTCTQGTPYKIGLQPSNNNQNGQGVMRAVQAGNPDGVPYQLRSTAGLNGTVWGNTATAQSTNNGVAGTGSGTAQKHDVYATISSVNNYRPGEYRDRVIINVHY